MRDDRGRIVAAIFWALLVSGCVNLRSEEVVAVHPSWSYTDQTAAAGRVGDPLARMTGAAGVVARRSGIEDPTRNGPFGLDQAIEAGPEID